MDAYVALRGQLPISSTHCLFLVVLFVSWAEDRAALLSSSLFWHDGSFLVCLQSLQMILQVHLRLQEKSFPLADLCCWKLPFLDIFGYPLFCVCPWGSFWQWAESTARLCLEPANQLLLSLPETMQLSHCLWQLNHLPHKVGDRVFLLPPRSWQLAALSVDEIVTKTVEKQNSPTYFSVRELRHYFILARMLLCPGSATEII